MAFFSDSLSNFELISVLMKKRLVMSKLRLEEFLEIRRSRALNASESLELEGLLAGDVTLRSWWEDECSLDEILQREPKLQLSSNFTAMTVNRVKQSLPPSETGVVVSGRRRWRRLWPRLIVGAGLATATFVAGIRFVDQQEKRRMADTVLSVSESFAVVSELTLGEPKGEAVEEASVAAFIEAMTDFQAIRVLNHVPASEDADLLAALE